ncbi:MBL fold metallo-hydrolase [Arthrobacter caoxuetaonis]|uniref:MBL fold metallo-hydrolase n=1 Tax=Arthrobacter caoxuetaonis TaxID=2886935 RepID=UPI0024345A0E|nr:MBL fold metallo-hydrolase [Arthrobacter caoxuetaonis]
MEFADGVYLAQGPGSNWVIIRGISGFTIIDGGYPADLPLVLDSIRRLGLSPADARAMLITHAHTDHTGAAQYFSDEFGTPILSSPGEHNSLLGREKYQVTVVSALPYLWRPAVFSWAIHAVRAGGTAPNSISAAEVWTEERLRELPGSPLPVMTPGHTAYHLPGLGVLVSGDALVTGHAISGLGGPQMLHRMFHHDLKGARSALDLIAAVDATVLLPGHGPGLMGTPAALVAATTR